MLLRDRGCRLSCCLPVKLWKLTLSRVGEVCWIEWGSDEGLNGGGVNGSVLGLVLVADCAGGGEESRSQGLKPSLWWVLMPGLKPRLISEANANTGGLSLRCAPVEMTAFWVVL